MHKITETSFNYFLLFLLNPVLMVLFLIRNYQKVPNRKSLIVLFSGFVGFAFYYLPGHDITSYVNDFNNFSYSLSQWIRNIPVAYKTRGARIDFYIDFVSYITKLFTDNSRVFIIMLGLIFGYFYANYLDLIIKEIKKKNLLVGIYLFFFVVGMNPQLGINYRFHAAGAILLYGFYQFYLFDKKNYILLVFLSVMVHSGMVAFIVLFLGIYLLRKSPLSALIILIISFFLSGIDFSGLASIFSKWGLGGFETKVDIYTSARSQDRYTRIYVSGGDWFFNLKARLYFIPVAILLVFFYIKRYKQFDSKTKLLFIASMLAASFWNFINSFPMAYRYEPLIVVLISSFFLVLNSNYKLLIGEKTIQYLGLSIMSLYIVVSFRLFLQEIPAHFLLSNPFLEGFLTSETDIYSYFTSFIK